MAAQTAGAASIRVWLWVCWRCVQARLPGRPRLWASPAEFKEGWKIRIAVMAGYIDRPGRVVDEGCGPMWLEQVLRADNTYVPIDYVRRDQRTIVIDLNTQQLPALDAEVAVLSGVLEYVRDIDSFVDQLAHLKCSRIIASYNTLERVPWMMQRRSLNWTSHLHLDDLLAPFCRTFNLVSVDGVGTNTILVFDRKSSQGGHRQAIG